MVFLYLHIPFCQKKCHYCSYSSCVAGNEVFPTYVAALKQELAGLAATWADRGLKSLFIGGGTPTLLPCALLAELVDFCQVLFPPLPEVEISIEANPGTVNGVYLSGLRGAGVNRLSLGVQSFNDQELLILGRIHDGSLARDAVQAAKHVGFTNINLDLMYGLPGQTAESWQSSLQQAISLGPQHLSLYQLTIEEGTPFHLAVATGKMVLPGEEEIQLLDEITAKLCGDAGFLQYEISNYAGYGDECAHNINYWQNGEYLACGASAVSCIAGVREKRIGDPLEYVRRIKEGRSVVMESECLTADASFRESVILGLRMTKGVQLQSLAARYHIDLIEYYGNTLKKLLTLQLVELTNSHLKLTPEGRLFANRVMAELV